VEKVELERLRQEVRLQFGIAVGGGGKIPDAQTFKRAIAAEVLSRRGLGAEKVAEVFDMSERGVRAALKIVRSRARKSKDFERYIEDHAARGGEDWIINAMLTRW
jgi:hypothetical protein